MKKTKTLASAAVNAAEVFWGILYYYGLVAFEEFEEFKKNWFDIVCIAAITWMLLHAIWVMMVAQVRIAAMGL